MDDNRGAFSDPKVGVSVITDDGFAVFVMLGEGVADGSKVNVRVLVGLGVSVKGVERGEGVGEDIGGVCISAKASDVTKILELSAGLGEQKARRIPINAIVNTKRLLIILLINNLTLGNYEILIEGVNIIC
jgi:hypothetical protein